MVPFHMIFAHALLGLLAVTARAARLNGASDDGMELTNVQEPAPAPQNLSCKPSGRFYFATGPTGAGKSIQEQRVLVMNKVNGCPGTFKMMLIDDYVEKDRWYKQNVLNYLKKELGSNWTKQSVEKWVQHADQPVYNKFAKLYFGSRTQHGCEMPGGCKAKFDIDLKARLATGKNICYECTGKKYPTEKLQAIVDSEKPYQIIIGAVTVNFDTLVARNQGRAAGAIIGFLKDPDHHSAPRLPDVRKCALGKAVREIVNAQTQMIDCIGSNNGSCAPGVIQEFYMYDGNFMPLRTVVEIKVLRTRSSRMSVHFNTKLLQQKQLAKDRLKDMLPSKDLTCE